MCEPVSITLAATAAALAIAGAATGFAVDKNQAKAQEAAAKNAYKLGVASETAQLRQQAAVAATKEESARIQQAQEVGKVQAGPYQGATLAAMLRGVRGESARDIARIGKNYEFARENAALGMQEASTRLQAANSQIVKPSALGLGLEIGAIGVGAASGLVGGLPLPGGGGGSPLAAGAGDVSPDMLSSVSGIA